VPVAADRVAGIIASVEREFEAGRTEWERGRFGPARERFDAALQILTGLPEGARGDARLATEFDSLLDRVTALELLAQTGAEGFTEARSEPAAIDVLLGETAFERPVPAATTAETVAADLARTPHDVPIPQNAKVLSYIELFQGRLREFIQAGLDRGQQYLPMITRVFKAEGVPLDLAYVPLVESAFKSTALSRASARGMWQFMSGTAREHDLLQTWFVDERGDPEKATLAAARYLKSLHETFDGDWHLALASYNGGPARLQGALRRSKKTDFWAVASTTRYLPRETREYVPMVLAAIVIARNPELYGFKVGAAAPLVYETVSIPDAVALATVAEWAGVSVDDLRALNPELRREMTPTSHHLLKVPVGTVPTIQARLAAHTEFIKFRFHNVKAGETLNSIARKYGFTTKQLRDANELRTSRVTRNQPLMIPMRPATRLSTPATAKPAPAPAGATATSTYRVRRGDTLYSIARQFDTTVGDIKRLNQLVSDRIKIGDRLTVPRSQ
jgi:membrane-bound lytic murein transglycosylase D